MSTYGMKDAANLVMISKKTGDVALYLDYANATSSEWTSERVFATKKGTQAIAWDSNRTGTLTVDSEIFDLSYLALAIGSEVVKGHNDILKREVITINESRMSKLDGLIEAGSVSAIKLKEDEVEHDGTPLVSTTGNEALLPSIVRNVSVAANADSAQISFDVSNQAVSYEIKRDETVVGTTTTNSFTDTGLTPDTAYGYTITAINGYGTAPVSAEVEVLTSAVGVTGRTQYTATPAAITAAELLGGVLNESGTNTVTFKYDGGKVQFNDKAVVGDKYAIYYLETIDNTRTITISSKKFPDSYEIYADARIREQETGNDEFVQIHYKNARPQSNFTLTQSATEPTSLSVVFDLLPDREQNLAEMKIVD